MVPMRVIDKIKKNLFHLLFLFLAVATFPSAHANYPTYLNGDRNFILVDGHMGTAWYVNRSSLAVLQAAGEKIADFQKKKERLKQMNKDLRSVLEEVETLMDEVQQNAKA